MMMLSSTPACASRTTCASGLVGAMLGGMVAGFSVVGGISAVASVISGAVGSAAAACTVETGAGGVLTTGGADVVGCALELACEQPLVNDSVANAAPTSKNLGMESFMICAFALDIVDRYRSFDGAGGWRIQMAEKLRFSAGFADLPRHACY